MLVSINVMKKYISKVSELVKHNTGAFLWILFICGGLMTLVVFLFNKFVFNTQEYISTTGMVGTNEYITGQAGEVFLFLLLSILVIGIFSAFIEGGFLSYLKKGRQEKDEYVNFFFKSAFGKWGRMIGATMMQYLMMLAYIIPLAIAVAILMAIFQISPGGGAGGGSGLIIASTLILIIVMVFTYFITFEAALKDETVVGEWVSNSFKKAKKVFWLMFFWIFVIIVSSLLIGALRQFGDLLYYGSYFLINLIFGYLTAFVFYPLYNLATERWLADRAEKGQMDEMDRKILESHYKKLRNEENKNPDASGFSE